MRIKYLGVVGLLFAFAGASFLLPQDAALGPPVASAQEDESAPLLETQDETAPAPSSAEANAQTSTETPTKAGDSADEKPIATTTKAEFSESTKLTQKVRASLDKVGDLEFVEVPFSDVKRDLEDLLGVNIILDGTAIDDCLTEEELVSIRLKNLRYSDSLRFLLSEFNATYTIQNGILRIISMDNINDPWFYSRAMLNVQPTLDLLIKFDGQNNNPRRENQRTLNYDIPMMVLSDTIMSVVQTDSWQETGKGKAVLKIAGGILIVRGTEELLDEVEDFVQDFHAQLEAKTP